MSGRLMGACTCGVGVYYKLSLCNEFARPFLDEGGEIVALRTVN